MRRVDQRIKLDVFMNLNILCKFFCSYTDKFDTDMNIGIKMLFIYDIKNTKNIK